MNPINYETHTFHLENNSTESQGVPEIDFDSLPSLIIDKQFFSKHSEADNFRKAALWDSLHLDFCQHPDVIEYASTSSGQMFAQKFKSVRYIKDKFQRIKADFRKVIMDGRRTGSGGPLPQSRYEHYDDMKHITLGDPSFWTPRISENAEVGLSKMLAEFSQMRELVAQTAEDMRRRDLVAAEARHLDRLAWAKIEENATRARKEIEKNKLEMKEKEMQLREREIQMREREMKSRERIAELKLELFNKRNPPQ
ncbi:hypothetical protein CLU79DRAFT_848921 [Phycomyces nitens]|nr:hypothetical protein CLU79DRAFT_848921 [Phycomyces nitens]